MSKPKHARRGPTPIDAAIERVEHAGPQLRPVQLITFAEALRLQPGGHLELVSPPVEGAAVILVQQAGEPWRAITMPPGSTWVLTEKPASDLWLPPGQGRPVQ